MFFLLYNFPVHLVTVCQNNVVYKPILSYSIFHGWEWICSNGNINNSTSNKYTAKYSPI